MCLGIPMQVKKINGLSALCEARGILREAGMLLMRDDELEVGDYVMISLGNIIARVSEQEAQQAWALYDELFERIDADAS